MLSRHVLARVGGIRGVMTGPAVKLRHDFEGHPPPPVTQLNEHEISLRDTGKLCNQ
ncbi:unnamed protein product [Strongylus vulgaris]|uniref:Uncharacterized protein n=1 Tax=Strongylus vulgaris TaxID=40348 RepID=A0A3P7JJ42_STRVU|nr:unnamed protein product [Strongylus vulgaris]